MKKLVLLVLAMVMLFTLVACGANNDKNDAATPAKEEQSASSTPADAGAGLTDLKTKYNTLATLVNDATVAAIENGWDKDEAFSTELSAAKEYLRIAGTDLSDPDMTGDEAYMNTLNTSFDEMIPAWEDFLAMVSVPYAA